MKTRDYILGGLMLVLIIGLTAVMGHLFPGEVPS